MKNKKGMIPPPLSIYKSIPAVYDDSLSYYELLCKIAWELQELIERVEGLTLETLKSILAGHNIQCLIDEDEETLTISTNAITKDELVTLIDGESNVSFTLTGQGTILVKASGGGGTGTDDYLLLLNKPQINGVTLTGNKTSEELGLASSDELTEIENIVNNVVNQLIEINNKIEDIYESLENDKERIDAIIRGDYTRAGNNITIDRSEYGITINATGGGGQSYESGDNINIVDNVINNDITLIRQSGKMLSTLTEEVSDIKIGTDKKQKILLSKTGGGTVIGQPTKGSQVSNLGDDSIIIGSPSFTNTSSLNRNNVIISPKGIFSFNENMGVDNLLLNTININYGASFNYSNSTMINTGLQIERGTSINGIFQDSCGTGILVDVDSSFDKSMLENRFIDYVNDGYGITDTLRVMGVGVSAFSSELLQGQTQFSVCFVENIYRPDVANRIVCVTSGFAYVQGEETLSFNIGDKVRSDGEGKAIPDDGVSPFTFTVYGKNNVNNMLLIKM